MSHDRKGQGGSVSDQALPSPHNSPLSLLRSHLEAKKNLPKNIIADDNMMVEWVISRLSSMEADIKHRNTIREAYPGMDQFKALEERVGILEDISRKTGHEK